MNDDALQRWAAILVDRGMAVEDGDLVEVSFGEPARPLALHVFRTVLDRGGIPVTDRRDAAFDRLLYEHGSGEQVDAIPDHVEEKFHNLDAQCRIRAPRNTRELGDVPGERINRRKRARQHLREHRIDNVKWALTEYPTAARAQEASMSEAAYRDFVVDACVRDWAAEAERYRPLKRLVDDGSEVRLVGDGTDLTLGIGEHDGVNRVGALSDGTRNVPGGEVFTTPIAESVEGEITFDIPAVVDGKAVEDVHLVFEDGEVVDHGAGRREDLLDDLLETDAGVRRAGEIGIGTNFAIDRFTHNILFDEKIGGTVHIALGMAYPFCLQRLVDTAGIDRRGLAADRFDALVAEAEEALRYSRFDAFSAGLDRDEAAVAAAVAERWRAMDDRVEPQVNRSAVHQDFVADLRDGGRLEIDGAVVLEDGSFVGVDALP